MITQSDKLEGLAQFLYRRRTQYTSDPVFRVDDSDQEDRGSVRPSYFKQPDAANERSLRPKDMIDTSDIVLMRRQK